jgi:RNA 2',3'-cyclic 3'-phosphodiesterase
MRIFIALDIPAEIRGRIAEFAERARPYAPEAKWARIEGLHVTLKFVGEANDAKVQEISSALPAVKAEPFDVTFSGAGFFPAPNTPRVFWIGVEGGEGLASLAAAIDNSTHKLGIAKEARAFSPHLTLARSGSGPGSGQLLRPLRNLLQPEACLHFGTMTAREFFLYRSELQRGGARYTKLERFGLEAY